MNRAALAAIVTQSTARRYAKLVAGNLLVLAALLVVAEGCGRLVYTEREFYSRTFPGQYEDRPVSWRRPDKDLGWVVSGTGLEILTRSGKDWAASVNQEGFRAKFNYGDRAVQAGVTRIMMLGDSFLFGPRLNDAETLPGQLQDRLGRNHEVYNFGIPGWGIDQMYLAYKKYVDIVEPDIVIVVYIDEDVLRVFEAHRIKDGMNKPSFTLVDGDLTPRTNDKPGLLEWVAHKSLIANLFYERVLRYRASAKIAQALFRELAQDAKQRNRRLIAVRYPSKEEILENKRLASFDLAEAFEAAGILFLDPADAMRASGVSDRQDFYLKGDGHPAAKGNEFVARYILANALSDR